MTAESNTKFMETAIGQKIPFLGLIILIFTVITSTRLGVASMCYILFFGIWYTLYMSSASHLPPQKVVAICHVMFGWQNGGWLGAWCDNTSHSLSSSPTSLAMQLSSSGRWRRLMKTDECCRTTMECYEVGWRTLKLGNGQRHTLVSHGRPQWI